LCYLPLSSIAQHLDSITQHLDSITQQLCAGRPEDIASACLFLCGNGGGFTTGANIVIDGGVLAAPRSGL
jgi:NAD(P)-dependent dehydrogenase (short-subunit alcohol dehydrogenase family)